MHTDICILKGWKKERVAQEYPEDGSRVLMIQHDDPKYAVKKVSREIC